MRIAKPLLAVLFAAAPGVAAAQVNVGVDVHVGADVSDDSYDTVAPGDPVESVDVFYDQLEPYGTWVDEPDAGRVFIPDQAGFVPYSDGHWQYTSLGFVWVANQPFGWATSHYGRWAFSNNYGRWVWLPDTQWGPAWVEWRQTGDHFGWSPLAPEVYVRAGYQPPIESWHYCGSDHVLDVNVTRYYEPRDRVVVIQREARPIVHYSTVSNVRVVVGPPPSVLREHRIAVRPVRADARVVGRWTPAEAHAQVAHAQEHKAEFEVRNQHRIDGNVKIHEAHARVIETHPAIRAQVNARVTVGAHPEPAHPEPRPAEHPSPGYPPRNEHAAPQSHEPPHEAPHAPPQQHEAPHPMPPAHEAPHPQPPAHEAHPYEPGRAAPPQQHEAPHAPPQQHEAPHAPAPQQHAPEQHREPPKQEPKHDDKREDKRY